MAKCAQCGEREAVQAGHCRPCWGHRLAAGRPRERWTAEMDAAVRAAYQVRSRGELSAAITRLERAWRRPRRKILQRAMRMGIAWAPRVRWTPADEAKLLSLLGKKTLKRIARELGKSEAAVMGWCQRRGQSAKAREGYTAQDLAWCFGEDSHKVSRWMRQGFFGDAGRQAGARVSERVVRRFIQQHHGEYDLRRVQQAWFVSLCFWGRTGGAAVWPE